MCIRYVTSLWAERPRNFGSILGKGKKISLLSEVPRSCLVATEYASKLVPGGGGEEAPIFRE